MNKVTEILQAARDDPSAAEHLLPLIYDELRRLASRRMGDERINHTLQPTALVHEAYIRLVGEQQADQPQWEGRAHFFAAAAEAMRRILIDRARRKQSLKRGGQRVRQPLNESEVAGSAETNELFAVDEALTKLGQEDADLATVVKLRYFAGMTVPETATALGVSPRTVDRQWACARAWLFREISTGK